MKEDGHSHTRLGRTGSGGRRNRAVGGGCSSNSTRRSCHMEAEMQCLTGPITPFCFGAGPADGPSDGPSGRRPDHGAPPPPERARVAADADGAVVPRSAVSLKAIRFGVGACAWRGAAVADVTVPGNPGSRPQRRIFMAAFVFP
ncbi:hypothetical protein [Azospirillum argentinense]